VPNKVSIKNRSNHFVSDEISGWKRIWENALQNQPHSYFLSWAWVSQWLKNLPLEVEVSLVEVETLSGRAVCFLGHNKHTRYGCIHSNSYYLNYTGLPLYDSLTLEYNQVLGQANTIEVLTKIINALPKEWDELHLPYLDTYLFPGNCLPKIIEGYKIRFSKQQPSYYVELKNIDETQDSYLNLLSGNTRNNIRRAMKKLNNLGALQLEPANDEKMALIIYDELTAMHQRAWQSRGQAGAFSGDWFNNFHRELIKERFSSGEVQLLRIACGEKTLGCLYNFVYQGTIYYYQSGFNYADFNDNKPGLVCHALAISFNANQGHTVYDFLAGDTQYKKSLATHKNQMVSCIIQKPYLRFCVENRMKKLKTRITNVFNGKTG
jgi:CelD/BcsL family acetyltransferase involved in cellulose biosynthesis